MKKLLLFLTLLSASHIAHGAKEVSKLALDNLWYSIVDTLRCDPQNMTPQEALDACFAEDENFSFDDFILGYSTEETHNTLLHCAASKNNLEHVQFIFEHINNHTKNHLILKKNQNDATPFDLAKKDIKNYILKTINSNLKNSLLCDTLKRKKYNETGFIIKFWPKIIFEVPNENGHFLIQILKQDADEAIETPLFQLISTIGKNKYKSKKLAKMLFILISNLNQKNSNEYQSIINEIIVNPNFNQDVTLNYFIRSNDYIWKDDLPAIEWLFKTFPEHQFADNSYINHIVSKNKDLTPQHLAIIQLLVDHKITSISPQHYDTLKAHQFVTDNSADDQKYLSLNNDKSKKNKDSTTSSPQRPAIIPFPLSTQHYDTLNAHQSVTDNSEDDSKYYSLNDDKSKVAQLTINSWTPQRSFGLKAISIAAVLYDFIRFKKPEKITDVKKDIKAKITDKSGTKKDTKKADIKHDTKESKEKKELSRWNRLVKHTRNYKKDLLKNPRNHKKLAIPFACLLIRALKDKTPLKGY